MTGVRALLRRRRPVAAPAAAGRPRLAERDRAAIEQRLKDLETFSDSLHRRWFMIAIGAALLSFARLLGYVSASLVTIGFVAGAAVLANVALRALLRRGWYRWWHVYVLALFDVTLVAVLVAFYGPGGFIAGFYLAVLPYAFDQGRTVGDFLVLTAALAYIAAAALHGRLYGSSAQALLDIPPRVYLDTILFMAVALTLKRIPGRLIERIRISRRVLHEVEDGDLTARAPAARSDELGFLERSLNRTLEETAATIAEVQREAETVATFAEELTRSAEFIVSEGERAASEAADLRRHSVEQRELAAAGGQGNAEAARDAHEMRGRAQRVEADARVLLEAADRGRERVARAGETLMAIGHEVQTTAATVQELSGLSERIGGFAQTIAKIARQTHLLALNAAIEAARAEERGAGFAAVADQIRNLAAETGRSARDVTDLIADVQSGMAAVAHAMAAGEAQVRDVGAVANEARHALEDIHGGALRAADLGTATADIARRQVERIADLAAKITRVEEISVGTSRSVESLATATRSQIAAIREFHATSQQLTGLAARLRTVIARFSVAPPDEPRPQHHGPRGRSGS